MEIIKYLAKNLAEQLGITTPAARGLIRLSIKDEFGPFKEITSLSYNDFYNVFSNSLKNRLIQLNISNYEIIVQHLLDDLTLNKSLITMEGVKI